MNPSPVTLVLAGIAFVTVGGAWAGAALLRRGKAGWLTPLALSAAFAAGAAGLTTVEPSLAVAAAGLSAASLLCALLRTEAPAWLARAAGRPAAQAAVIGLAGFGLVAYGMHRIDADLETEMDASARMLDSLGCSTPVETTSAGAARTDLGRTVPLCEPSADDLDGLRSFSEKDYMERMNLNARLIQTGPVDGEYNCHGWVFTGGRCWVRGGAVDAILTDNGYRETQDPAAGDLCVYRDQAGQVAHTAVVRGVGGAVLLESKWGKLGRYIHLAVDDHVYPGHKLTYYRTGRGTHLLAGLDGERESTPVFASAE